MEFSLYPIAFICGFSFVSVLQIAFSLSLWKKEKKTHFLLVLNCGIGNKIRHCLPSTGERYKFVNSVVNQFSRLSIVQRRRDVFFFLIKRLALLPEINICGRLQINDFFPPKRLPPFVPTIFHPPS